MTVLNALSDVDVVAISIVKQGANRQRFFLRKAEGDPDPVGLITLPADDPALIVKSDWSAAYCVVAEPGARENPGLHGEATSEDTWADADEIRKAAHRFMKNGALVNKMHESLNPYGQLVENAVALGDFEVDGQWIKKGSWYVAIEPSDEGRKLIEAGEFQGISIEGTGTRTPVTKADDDDHDGGLFDDEYFGTQIEKAGGKKRKFDESKHHRNRGRFASRGGSSGAATGDKVSGSTGGSKSANAQSETSRGREVKRRRGQTRDMAAAELAASRKRLATAQDSGTKADRRDARRHVEADRARLGDEKAQASQRKANDPKTADPDEWNKKPDAERLTAMQKFVADGNRLPKDRKFMEDGSIVTSKSHPDLFKPKPKKMAKNWVDDVGGFPPGNWIKRAAGHIRTKGMTQSRSYAVAVNAAKKLCATGDLNYPGLQQANPGSKADACKAVAEWEAMKAAAKGKAVVAKGDRSAWAEEETEEGAELVLKHMATAAGGTVGGMETGIAKMLARLLKGAGVDEEEIARLSGDEDLAKGDRTFATAMAQRELDDELPQALDAFRSIVWGAFSPYNDNAPADPKAVIAQSCDEFKTWVLGLLENMGTSADSATEGAQMDVAKAMLGECPPELTADGANFESMDSEQIVKAVTDSAEWKSLKAGMDAIEATLTRLAPKEDDAADAGGDAEGDKGKAPVAKGDDAPTVESLAKDFGEMLPTIAKMADQLDALSEGESTQDAKGGKVTKSDDDLIGLLG